MHIPGYHLIYSVMHSDVNHAAIRTRPIEKMSSIINTPNNHFIIIINYIEVL